MADGRAVFFILGHVLDIDDMAGLVMGEDGFDSFIFWDFICG
jgi:hypothetical protein